MIRGRKSQLIFFLLALGSAMSTARSGSSIRNEALGQDAAIGSTLALVHSLMALSPVTTHDVGQLTSVRLDIAHSESGTLTFVSRRQTELLANLTMICDRDGTTLLLVKLTRSGRFRRRDVSSISALTFANIIDRHGATDNAVRVDYTGRNGTVVALYMDSLDSTAWINKLEIHYPKR
jgi:hypothetical protein